MKPLFSVVLIVAPMLAQTPADAKKEQLESLKACAEAVRQGILKIPVTAINDFSARSRKPQRYAAADSARCSSA
jgi:hypothetical protein